MNHKAYLRRIFLPFFCLFSFILTAQTPQTLDLRRQNVPPTIINAPKPDWARIKAEEKTALGQMRFAVPLPLNVLAEKAGTWKKTITGVDFHEIIIRSESALAMAMVFENMQLKGDAALYIFGGNDIEPKLKYGANDVGNNHKLMTELVNAESVRIAYFPPSLAITAAEKEPQYEITNVYHAYNLTQLNDPKAFGDALECHLNVNCTEGVALRNQKRSVVRILVAVEGGLLWCSGALINNTLQDGKPYVLSANHCVYGMTPQYDLWKFYFNYESTTCANPITEPGFQVLQGCVERAGGTDSDFLLLEISRRIPASFNAFFSGWNRDSTRTPSSASIIHHPRGDIKKISVDAQSAGVNGDVISWGTEFPASPVFSHLRQNFEKGTLEPGSSGGPIFDQNGRIVGQLHGASIPEATPCAMDFSLSGWFAYSWRGRNTVRTSLRSWLDPVNSGIIALDGVNAPAESVSVSGKILTWKNNPIPNAIVKIGNFSTMSNQNGEFSFSALPANEKMSLTVEKNDNFDNGVDVADMFLTRQHVLDINPFKQPAQFFCADLNNNQEVDVADLFIMRRLILQLPTDLAQSKPWHFFTKTTFNAPAFPFGVEDPQPFSVEFTRNTTDYTVYGLKKSDVDDSAEY